MFLTLKIFIYSLLRQFLVSIQIKSAFPCHHYFRFLDISIMKFIASYTTMFVTAQNFILFSKEEENNHHNYSTMEQGKLKILHNRFRNVCAHYSYYKTNNEWMIHLKDRRICVTRVVQELLNLKVLFKKSFKDRFKEF